MKIMKYAVQQKKLSKEASAEFNLSNWDFCQSYRGNFIRQELKVILALAGSTKSTRFITSLWNHIRKRLFQSQCGEEECWHTLTKFKTPQILKSFISEVLIFIGRLQSSKAIAYIKAHLLRSIEQATDKRSCYGHGNERYMKSISIHACPLY